MAGERDDDPDRRPDPDESKDECPRPAGEAQTGDGGVAAGDGEEDRRVVHALQQTAGLRRPVEQVVGGADGEEAHQRDHVDDELGAVRAARATKDERRACGEDADERAEVQPAAQQRLARRTPAPEEIASIVLGLARRRTLGSRGSAGGDRHSLIFPGWQRLGVVAAAADAVLTGQEGTASDVEADTSRRPGGRPVGAVAGRLGSVDGPAGDLQIAKRILPRGPGRSSSTLRPAISIANLPHSCTRTAPG